MNAHRYKQRTCKFHCKTLTGLWGHATIRKILTNRVYIGELIQRKGEMVSYHADGQGHGAEGHDTVAGQGIQHMAAEQTHQDDGGGVAHEEHGRGGAGGHAQALHEVDGQGRHDAEGKAGQIDAAQAGVGHGIEDGARRHLVLGRIGGDLGLAQLGGQGHEHAQCGDGQHGHEGEQTGLTAQQVQIVSAVFCAGTRNLAFKVADECKHLNHQRYDILGCIFSG